LIVAVTVLGEVGSELAGPVGGIGEHLNRGGLAGVQAGGGLSVADVAGSQLASGDQPGFGFNPNVSFEPVAIVVVRLVHVARLRIDDRHDPIRFASPARSAARATDAFTDAFTMANAVSVGIALAAAATVLFFSRRRPEPAIDASIEGFEVVDRAPVLVGVAEARE
jgi:hypothetical protein